ncbi:flavodoxin [Lacticaseibacillus suilingensis]|uniref:Flavodoxin n=1 Tax=Lacticaseibacillus suilingensis TaxID=2799577 RepID=A0ABW4BDX0_9LACO|nr:flavodoxin [Lacticaseibacillus suilingensis]
MATAKIVYASMTGNNEEIAGIVEEELENYGYEVETTEVSQAMAEDFQDADICVVATYTYSDVGEGVLPDEAVDFFDDLKTLDLSGKVYGCCGSGDRFYDDFCTSVDDFDQAFAATGATKGAANVKIDLAPEADDIKALEKFCLDLKNKAQSL